MNLEAPDFFKNFDDNLLYKNRLATFKKWPYSSKKKCSIQKMAEAGFYKVQADSKKDDVICFCCFLEVDSWEATDDPLEEHKKFSENCLYIRKVCEKGVDGLTVGDMIDINEQRYTSLLDKAYKEKISLVRTRLEEAVTTLRENFAKML